MIHSVSIGFTTSETVYLGSRIRGRIQAVKVVADSSLTNSFDLTLTGETSGVPILTDTTVSSNATTWWYPRALAADSSDGSASTDAFWDICVYEERIKAVIANAGTGVGTITVYFFPEDY